MIGIGGMGGMPKMGRWKLPGVMTVGIKTLQGIQDIAEESRTEEEMTRSWSARVGDARAQIALEIWKRHKGDAGYASSTLPELLTEAALIRRGVRFEAQITLAFGRPDFVVFSPDQAGCIVLLVQGEYWHSRPAAVAKDGAQKALYEKTTVHGLPVTAVVWAWELDLYNNEDAVIDAALRGINLR